jgi:hypothetical protein
MTFRNIFKDIPIRHSVIFLNFQSLIIGIIPVICSIILIVLVVFLIKKFKFGSHHLNCMNKKIKSRKKINKKGKDDVIPESFSIFNKN